MMADRYKWLGKHVVAKTAYGDKHSEGHVVAYYGQPSLTIKRDDGTKFHWRADLCRVVEDDPVSLLRELYEEIRAGSDCFDDAHAVVFGPDFIHRIVAVLDQTD